MFPCPDGPWNKSPPASANFPGRRVCSAPAGCAVAARAGTDPNSSLQPCELLTKTSLGWLLPFPLFVRFGNLLSAPVCHPALGIIHLPPGFWPCGARVTRSGMAVRFLSAVTEHPSMLVLPSAMEEKSVRLKSGSGH